MVELPRGENPLVAADSALLRFAADLRRLRQQAGSPTYRELSRRAHFSAAALSEAANGRQLPSLAVTVAYVIACDGDPVAWRTRWQAVLDTDSTTPPLQCGSAPYPGPAAFQRGDADLFFGRDTVIDDLVVRLRSRRFLGVFGASGAGKSSVLRAGLMARWRSRPALLFTPGPHPIEECAVGLAALTGESAAVLRSELHDVPDHLHLRIRQAMADHPADVDLLVVVDQFEEAFTLCEHEERNWFINALLAATATETSRARVVLGVRADFHGRCGDHPELVTALRDGQVLLGLLGVEELRQAITGPAATRGFMVESALVTRLIADATGQAAALPLVSHALLETWRRRRGATLTLAGYRAAGGIHHVICRNAEDLYATLDADQRGVARQIFLRLIALEGAQATKRRIHRRELDTDNEQTLDRLARARLITLDHDSVELAHEVLIRCWPRLREWLDDDRDGLRVHRQLTDATDVWESLDRDPGALYRGARLDLAQDWARSHQHALTARERAFLRSSTDLAADRAAARRRTRRLGQLVAVLSVLLVLATLATLVAVRV